MKLYRVKDWNSIYENNRTRELKNLLWVPVPNKHDGDGYTILVDRKDAASYLGGWLAILQVASKCDPRGTLLRDGAVPHDSVSIARITRLPKDVIERTLEVCIKECKWIEIIDINVIPQEGAGFPQEGALEGKGIEGKGMEGRNGTECLVEGGKTYSPESRVALHWLNEKSGKHFRECQSSLEPIHARLKECGVCIEGVKQMIERQCKRWMGTAQEEYLRPQTLFGKEKFDGYYAAKDSPINTNETHQRINGISHQRIVPDHSKGF